MKIIRLFVVLFSVLLLLALVLIAFNLITLKERYSYSINVNILNTTKTASGSDPTYCELSFEEPWFIVKNPQGYPLLIVSSNGNVYINSTEFREGESNIPYVSNAFVVKDTHGTVLALFRYDRTMIAGSVIQGSVPSSPSSSLVFKTPDGKIVAVIDSSGNLYALGKVAAMFLQAGCPSDTYVCNKDTGDIDKRDYYCDAPEGVCKYKDIFWYDCPDDAPCLDIQLCRNLGGYCIHIEGKVCCCRLYI